jgi:hypothetical protein
VRHRHISIHAAVLTFALALAACGGSSGKPAQPKPRDAFESYPSLAYVPADTPYAFVVFEPASLDLIRRMYGNLGSVWQQATSSADGPAAGFVHAIGAELGDVSVERLKEVGFTPTPRMALYGVGGYYPVFRIDVADGARVFAFAERVFARMGGGMPKPSQRGDRRYWTIPMGVASALVAIAPNELIFSVAPADVLLRELDAVLGDKPQATPIEASVFRALAAKNGFSGNGVGFVEVARAIRSFAEVAGAPKTPDCTAAVDEVAQLVPRAALGLTIAGNRISYGVVVELAAPIVAALRAISTTIPQIDEGDHPPLMSFAAALDVDLAFAMIAPIGHRVRDIARRCQVPEDLVPTWTTELGTSPIPAALAGLTGVGGSLQEMGTDPKTGQQRIDGYGVLHLADPMRVITEYGGRVGLNPQTFMPGIAQEVLAGLAPFPVHVGISSSSVAVGIGPGSRSDVENALAAKPGGPSPLFHVTMDYKRFSQLDLDGTTAINRALASSFRDAAFDVVVEDRGLVTYFTAEIE